MKARSKINVEKNSYDAIVEWINVKTFPRIAGIMIVLIGFHLQACSRNSNSSYYETSESSEEGTATFVSSRDEDPTDQEITNAVTWELAIQDGVSSNYIDVTTADGIVTLSGTTNNILGKDRATNIAQMVKGVRAVINRITVIDSGKKDEDIESDVTLALAMDPATESYDVNVEVSKGKVKLTGTVQSWQEKQLAAKVSKGVDGVLDLENNITVNFMINRTDLEIKNEIVQVLRWDAMVDDGLIDVTVNNGKVSLSGIVGSAQERNIARADAWVAGVKQVNDDNLKVERWARDPDLKDYKYQMKSDEEIKKAVEDAFVYDPRVFSFDLKAHVSSGEVTLTGIVDNLKAKSAAEMDAKNVVGVWKVTNLIKVRPAVAVADTKIEKDVKAALVFNPDVNKYEVRVAVFDGKVYLNGIVDSNYEKYEAEQAASGVTGVVSVENNLTVDSNAIPYVYNFNHHYYRPAPPVYNFTTKSDYEIKKDIQHQLWWSPFVDQNNIKVEVQNGVATLTGTVDSYREYNSAEKNAYEGGAVTVDNKLALKMG